MKLEDLRKCDECKKMFDQLHMRKGSEGEDFCGVCYCEDELDVVAKDHTYETELLACCEQDINDLTGVKGSEDDLAEVWEMRDSTLKEVGVINIRQASWMERWELAKELSKPVTVIQDGGL